MRPDSLADPVQLTVHELPGGRLSETGMRAGDARTRGRLTMLLVLLACAAPVLASYFTYYVLHPRGSTNYGTLIEPTREIPATLVLTRLDGQAVAPAKLKEQWLLIVVAGGSCDQRCEHLLWLQRQLRETLGREKGRLDRVWLVDDTAPVRAELLPAMQGAEVLRVDPVALSAWLQPEPGAGLREHLYLVDPRGWWMMRFPVDPDAKRVKRDLDRLLRAAASYDREGR